ncbi:MAG: pyruvoyl-dependent arginine decarboxylase [Thermoplasmata archaeon]
MIPEAKRYVVCKGSGTSSVSQINAFDEALVDAGVGDLNLIKVSSVLPPDIVETREIPKGIGTFHPCVIARAEGFKTGLKAGLCYGFREDGSGGYVVEHAVTTDDITADEFNEVLHQRLMSIGELRGVKLVDVKSEISERSIKDEVYGCAVVVLVYLP